MKKINIIIVLSLVFNIMPIEYGISHGLNDIKNEYSLKYFGTFQGQDDACKYLKDNLYQNIISNINDLQSLGVKGDDLIRQSIANGFNDINRFIIKLEENDNEERKYPESFSSSAIVAFINHNKLFVANVGNCKAVLAEKQMQRYIDENQNNYITLPLNQTDTKFGQNNDVISYNDISVTEINSKHDFLVLASEKLWQVFKRQEVVDFIHKELLESDNHVCIKDGKPIIDYNSIAKKLSSNAENATVIIISLNNLQTTTEVLPEQKIVNNSVASQIYKEKIKSFLYKNYNNPYLWALIPTLYELYIQKDKIQRYVKIIKKVMESHPIISRGYLTYIGGILTIIFFKNQNSAIVSSTQANELPSRDISESSLPNRLVADEENNNLLQNKFQIRQVMESCGLDSGYYAIKDGYIIWQEQNGIISSQQANEKLLKSDQDLDKAVNLALGYNGDDMSDHICQADLVKDMKSDAIQKVFKEWNVINKQNYSVIPDIETHNYASAQSFEENIKMLELWESFRKDLEKVHLFVLATESKSQEIGDTKFWFSIVVNKKKIEDSYKLSYHVMNSHSAYPLELAIKKLENLIENNDLNVLKIQLKMDNNSKDFNLILSTIEKFIASNTFTKNNINSYSSFFNRNTGYETDKFSLILRSMDELIKMMKIMKQENLKSIVLTATYADRIAAIKSKLSPYFQLDGNLASSASIATQFDNIFEDLFPNYY